MEMNPKGIQTQQNTKQIKNLTIPCALKGCTPCPHIACDGYHRQCEIWRNHSGR